MLFFRISNVLCKVGLKPLGRLFWLINRLLLSIDIDPRATLKGGVVILHGAGIVIGRYVIAEGDFTIYQGATLGGNNNKEALYKGKTITQPVLMHGCVIGIHAVVMGPVILHNNVRVGANAIVTKNVPENAVVVSNNKILK
ncbi:hypothetical protein [Niabella sp.]|uniref:serine O-acetyltransferase n=1 Tax=Niabella sp. TaxID=1962976 RepID=UPI00260642D2|nr:hypothetical protein [Niabella sp.]